MRISQPIGVFIVGSIALLLSSCADNERGLSNEMHENRGNMLGSFDEEGRRSTYEQQMIGSDLQAINEDFNAESIQGKPSYPENGIVSINEAGEAVYENNVTINRDGMVTKLPAQTELKPEQYRAYIRKTVHDISRTAVYPDGRIDEITQQFYEVKKREMEELAPPAQKELQKDISRKLEAINSCYEMAGFNEALQEYLGGIIAVLTEAKNDGSYEKYIDAVMKIQSLNSVVNNK